MTKEDILQYWLDSSDSNYTSMLNMFNSGEYMWSLFVGHLAVEKLLKAYYVKTISTNVPITHDLYKLATKANLILSEEQKDILQYITLFNIEARYEEYKNDFYKKCKKEFTEHNIEKIKGIITWLKIMIKS